MRHKGVIDLENFPHLLPENEEKNKFLNFNSSISQCSHKNKAIYKNSVFGIPIYPHPS